MNQPSPSAPMELAGRLFGPEAGQRFEFTHIPPDAGRDTFEIEGGGKCVSIRGSSVPAMAMGLNWYLKHYARVHVSWHGSHKKLPGSLPAIPGVIRRTAWARWRYFLNYCCFSYSMPYWSWEQWEPLIDWMALNGINMPLAITGQEAVWQRVCRRLGLDEAEISDFLPGPAYLPFGWMGCLDGWGGPLPGEWIAQHEILALNILKRERELGMTPVLQGFTGHIPAGLAKLHPEARVHRIQWHEWETCLLDPQDPLFASTAALYLEEQVSIFGTNHHYAADTFIEMTPPSGDAGYLAALSRAILAGMTVSDPDAVWVLQGWMFMYKREFWTQPRIDAFLKAIPDEHILLLDLHCESEPMWEKTEAFAGKPWLWCNVQNFGRNVHMNASLEANNTGLFKAMADPRKGQLAGIGIVNEGLCYSPEAYDFFFEQAWRESEIDLAAWGRNYCHHRYGRAMPATQRAWEILIRTVYSRFQWAYPELLRNPIEAVRKTDWDWTPDLIEAHRLLLSCAGVLGDMETYRFDLVQLGRQILSNTGSGLKAQIHEAVATHDLARFDELADEIRTLITDMDRLLATHRDFLLGTWIAQARRWGANDAEKDRLEWEARRQITLWGESNAVRDYAFKEWSGLLVEYHLPRWERYFESVRPSVQNGEAFDTAAFDLRLMEWERAWSDSRKAHPCTEIGDSIAVTREVFASSDFTELAPI